MSTPLPQDGVESQGLLNQGDEPHAPAQRGQARTSNPRPSFREIIRQARLAA